MRACPHCGGTYPVDEGFCPMDGVRLRTSHGVGTAGAGDDPFAVALLGRVLDRRYRLDEIIGLGAMGIVFRATHVLIGKTLAVKVLRREHGGTGEVARRFLLEARVASSLKHPNVVEISDFGGLDEGGAYYVMEHLAGRTLADRIDRDGPLPAAAAVAIALQICHGLTAAHGQGVVHRDLKPDNVFLATPRPGSEEPVVKLLDFGIARAGPRRITAMGAVLGTPEYMAPEQARGIDIDHRVDLYALGVILFEMLAGSVPFHHAQVAQVIDMQVNAAPPRLASRRAELGELARIDDVIQSLLSKSREARPATAESTVTVLLAASASDLGRDAAERLQRNTIAIGSGMIAEPSDGTPAATWSEPTTWKGGAKPGERSAAPDPLLATGPVPTVTHPGGLRRSPPSPARPVAIGAVAAVLAGGVTFGAVQWLRDPGLDPGRGTDPAGSPDSGAERREADLDVVEERSRADASETSPRSIAPAIGASSRAPAPVTPITVSPAYDSTTVTTPASTTTTVETVSDESTADGKPQPLVERSSARDDKAATKRRTKPDPSAGETPREPPPTRPPTSAPPESDPSPKSEPPPSETDPKPSRLPGDLKDPFPAN